MVQRYLKRASGDYVIAVDWSQSTDTTADPNFNTETAYTDPNARVYELKGNPVFPKLNKGHIQIGIRTRVPGKVERIAHWPKSRVNYLVSKYFFQVEYSIIGQMHTVSFQRLTQT